MLGVEDMRIGVRGCKTSGLGLQGIGCGGVEVAFIEASTESQISPREKGL